MIEGGAGGARGGDRVRDVGKKSERQRRGSGRFEKREKDRRAESGPDQGDDHDD